MLRGLRGNVFSSACTEKPAALQWPLSEDRRFQSRMIQARTLRYTEAQIQQAKLQKRQNCLTWGQTGQEADKRSPLGHSEIPLLIVALEPTYNIVDRHRIAGIKCKGYRKRQTTPNESAVSCLLIRQLELKIRLELMDRTLVDSSCTGKGAPMGAKAALNACKTQRAGADRTSLKCLDPCTDDFVNTARKAKGIALVLGKSRHDFPGKRLKFQLVGRPKFSGRICFRQ